MPDSIEEGKEKPLTVIDAKMFPRSNSINTKSKHMENTYIIFMPSVGQFVTNPEKVVAAKLLVDDTGQKILVDSEDNVVCVAPKEALVKLFSNETNQ